MTETAQHIATTAGGKEAARVAALRELHDHALPTDAPGAWVRAAIEAELSPGDFDGVGIRPVDFDLPSEDDAQVPGYAMPASRRRQLDDAATSAAAQADAVQLFDQLVREVRAGRCLVSLAPLGAERHRAACDALELAGDVLDDARRLLAGA